MKPNKIVPFVFFLISLSAVLVFVLVNCTDRETFSLNKKDSENRIVAEKYISVADSIRNADPDSAILLYNKAIELIVPSDKDSAGNQALSSAYTGLAFVNLLKQDFEKAQAYDSIALSLANKANNKIAVAKALNIKALFYLYLSEADSALAIFSDALDYASDANDFELQAKILSNRAQAYSFFGNAEKMIEGFSDALEMAKKLGKGQFIAQCYMNLGMALEQQGRGKEKVKKIYEEVLPILQSTGDKDGEMLCLQSLGGIHCSLAAYDKAIDCFNQSVGLAEQLDNKQGISTGFYNLAEVYSRINDNKTAIDFYLRAMKIREEIGDKKGLVNCHTGLGSLYYDVFNYQEALLNFQKAFSLSKEIGYQRGIGQGYCNLASCFSPLGEKDSALICYQKAIDIYQQIGDYSGLADIYSNIGTEYENSKDYNKAEEYLSRALKIKKDLGEKEAIAQALFTIGEMFLTKTTIVDKSVREGLFRKAEAAALESYEIARQINSLKVMYGSSHLLEKIYLRTGNLQGLKQYSIICDATRDSLLNRDKVETLAFAKARWDVGKKQEEIDHLKETGELQQEVIAQKETESRQQKIIIGFSILLFALLLTAGIIAWVYFRKKREIEYQRQVANIGILQMQNIRNVLSPHFLFNVLNNIWAIIDDREHAKEQLGNLSALIRKSLVNTEKIAIPLSDEIEFVKKFLELQKLRMDGNLEVKWNIGVINPDTLVPGMILQIPVENAIKHGLAPKQGDRKLDISIHTESDYLNILVTDNGVGLRANSAPSGSTGTGLKALAKMIQILNQKNTEKITFGLSDRDEEGETGAKAAIRIPASYNFKLNEQTN